MPRLQIENIWIGLTGKQEVLTTALSGINSAWIGLVLLNRTVIFWTLHNMSTRMNTFKIHTAIPTYSNILERKAEKIAKIPRRVAASSERRRRLAVV